MRLSEIELPGSPEVWESGKCVQEATGWRRFKKEATQALLRVLKEAEENNLSVAETTDELMREANHVAEGIWEEEVLAKSKKGGGSIGVMYAEARKMMDLSERAKQYVAEGKGVVLSRWEYTRGGLMEPDSVSEARHSLSFEGTNSREAVLEIKTRIAAKVAEACQVEAARKLSKCMQAKNMIQIKSINGELLDMMERRQAGFMTAAMSIIRMYRGAVEMGRGLMAHIRPDEDPKKEPLVMQEFVT